MWHTDKLESQLALMDSTGADVVSSNVTSFESLPGGGVGERHLIRKSQPMRDWDFLFEAAGPGSTYVFSPQAHSALVEVINRLDYSRIGVHAGTCTPSRAAIGLTWVIGEEPTWNTASTGATSREPTPGPARAMHAWRSCATASTATSSS